MSLVLGYRTVAKKGEGMMVAEDGAGLAGPPLVGLKHTHGFFNCHDSVLLYLGV